MRINHYSWIAVFLCLLVTGLIFATEATDTRLEVEIFYIPREDLHRVPGYTDQGAFLPLSEILDLTRKAQEKSVTGEKELDVHCESIHLEGILKEELLLEGVLKYVAPSEKWSATLIDEGTIPWIMQSNPSQGNAHLVRVNGQTFLFARGAGDGQISLTALYNLNFTHSIATLKTGKFFAPCEIIIRADKGYSVESTVGAVRVNEHVDVSDISIYPTEASDTSVRIHRKVDFDAPDFLSLHLSRIIRVAGAGLIIDDHFTFTGRFSPNEEMMFPLPDGITVLQVKSDEGVQVTPTSDSLRLTKKEEVRSFGLWIQSAAEIKNHSATLGNWVIPADSTRSNLQLISSDNYFPFLTTLPTSLIPTGGTNNSRRYDCWDLLPELNITLVPLEVFTPPEVVAHLKISRNEATANYTIQIAGLPSHEYFFRTPEEWIVSDVRGIKQNRIVPLSIHRKEKTWWGLSWHPMEAPETIELNLHRAGSWGAPRTISNLDIPFITFPEPRPLRYDVSIDWDEGLKIRTRNLEECSIVPALTEDRTRSQTPALSSIDTSGLVLRAEGAAPAGLISVEGRTADVRATVVSSLSIGEDSTIIRALIRYEVQVAPLKTFSFVLPSATGSNIRIQGEGIREKTVEEKSDGDYWTVTTQHDVLGTFDVVLEWQIGAPEPRKPITAPQIAVKNVTSQQGYIALEGSETLGLSAETKNLSETDISDLPILPWQSDKRILAAYRYVKPPYTLKVVAEKIKGEPPLEALVSSASFTTTITPEGQRFTDASYSLLPRANRQFFEVQLPDEAELWAVLVNEEGALSAKRKTPAGDDILMVPLPSADQDLSDVNINIIYREKGNYAGKSSLIKFSSPHLDVPVNKTSWTLNLPPGFEYLSYGGEVAKKVSIREPFIRFLRTAYYPERILVEDMPAALIIFFSILSLGIFISIWNSRHKEKKKPKKGKEEKKVKKAKHVSPLLTIIHLIIILVIIAALIAIAVPNFLEAQVRSKVSRVRSDARSLATAIEAYYIDNNAYPHRIDILWQGPIKYIHTGFEDPYSKTGANLQYLSGEQIYERVREAVPVPLDKSMFENYWLVYSLGPDGVDQGGMVIYDPTNGTVSTGDVIRVKDGAGQFWEPRYREVREKELAEAVVETMYGLTTPYPPPSTHALAPVPETSYYLTSFDQVLRQMPEMPYKRREGLQSLIIEIPSGGMQRVIETLGYESGILIRLLEENDFLRLKFIVWFSALLVMVIIWSLSRKVYKIAFIVGSAISLFIPLIIDTPWVVFYNTAFQGILFSLVAPLLAAAVKQMVKQKISLATGFILIVGLTFLPLEISAEEVVPYEAPNRNIRLIVPYDEQIQDTRESDPLTFISRQQFETLWNLAYPELEHAIPLNSFLTGFQIEGTLNPETSAFKGQIHISACNPNDTPSTIPLKLKGLNLSSIYNNRENAFIESRKEELLLILPPGWKGRVTADFTLPCRIQGTSGDLKIALPEVAAGYWHFTFPYPDLTIDVNDNIPFLTEKTDSNFIVHGFARPGPLELRWNSKLAGKEKEAAEFTWKADIGHHFTWDTTKSTTLYAKIIVTPLTANTLLPETLEFRIPSDLIILGISGEDVRKAQVSGQTITVTIAEKDKTEISIFGTQLKKDSGNSANADVPSEWIIEGLRPSEETGFTSTLALEVSNAIEILKIKTTNLEPVSTGGARSGFMIRRFRSTEPGWNARFRIQTISSVFDADVYEVVLKTQGFIRRAVEVNVSPKIKGLHEIRLQLPPTSRVESVSGIDNIQWVQQDETLYVAFPQLMMSPFKMLIIIRADPRGQAGEFIFEPIDLIGSREIDRSGALVVPIDEELVEVNIGHSRARGISETDRNLFRTLQPDMKEGEYFLRGYILEDDTPLEFRFLAVPTTVFTTIYNLVTISDGLQSLESVIRAEPRRGRLKELEIDLLIPSPEPDIGSRIRVYGPVRNFKVVPVDTNRLRMQIELNRPHASPVILRIAIDQPVRTENNDTILTTVAIPAEGEGTRSFLLLRCALEGELRLAEDAGARVVDPHELNKPHLGLVPLPSDQSLELARNAEKGPSFKVRRHERIEGLRAIVEILRQRTIISSDGFERHELEIILQNQSEQFLKVAFPYPQSKLSIYEVQVASRSVPITFGKEDNRDILLIPLIRTGLLEPELSVRVAYTVKGLNSLEEKGHRRQRMPEILGGVPVAQSALVLMLPPDFEYKDFQGTLNEVELVDIEVDEALRQAKRVKEISEVALYTTGDKQQQALSTLRKLSTRVQSKVEYAEKTTKAYSRVKDISSLPRREFVEREEVLTKERDKTLREAQMAQQVIVDNVAQLDTLVRAQQPEIQVEMVEKTPEEIVPSPAPPIQFPRSGNVYVFRQLQGTGHIEFDISSMEDLKILSFLSLSLSASL